jgi:TldD protein
VPDTPFRPFDDLLDRDAALSRLREAVAGADDGELFLERRRGEVLGFDDGRLKTATYEASEGFGLRAVRGETAGYAHSTEISEPALARAVATARLAVGAGGGTLAAPPPRTNRKLYGDDDPMEARPSRSRVDTLREIDAFARGPRPPAWCRSRPSLSALLTRRSRSCGPEGDLVTEVRPMSRSTVSSSWRRTAGARPGPRLGRPARPSGPDRPRDLGGDDARGAAHRAREPARRGRARGRHGRGAGPGWPGILLHEAVGHGLEGDFNRKGTSAFAGLMGQRVAAPA